MCARNQLNKMCETLTLVNITYSIILTVFAVTKCIADVLVAKECIQPRIKTLGGKRYILILVSLYGLGIVGGPYCTKCNKQDLPQNPYQTCFKIVRHC